MPYKDEIESAESQSLDDEEFIDEGFEDKNKKKQKFYAKTK